MKKIILLLSLLMINTNKEIKEYCDIKGNVKNPGVYEIKKNYTIQDIINDAGGINKNSYTDNINLSKKVVDEMVIYIFSDNEINKLKQTNNCVCETIYKYIECEKQEEIEITTKPITITEPTTTKIIQPTTNIQELININLCTKEELLILDGLGEKKAEAIINYRLEFGLFKSIEEIINVNGIGKNTFDKIKEYIKV